MIYLLALLMAGPTIRVIAPKTILAPSVVQVRAQIDNPPDCFALVIYYGDGESSGMETCDESSWTREHKYHARPSQGSDISGNPEYYYLGEVQLWTVVNGKPKLIAREEFRIRVAGG